MNDSSESARPCTSMTILKDWRPSTFSDIYIADKKLQAPAKVFKCMPQCVVAYYIGCGNNNLMIINKIWVVQKL